MPCGNVTRNLRAGPQVWARFGRHWEYLAPDAYAEAVGVRRLRRYGQFLLHDGSVHRMPDRTFTQPDDSNPLYVGQGRDFAPLTDAFARDPLLHRPIKLLGRVADVLDGVAEWNVKVHLSRVRSATTG